VQAAKKDYNRPMTTNPVVETIQNPGKFEGCPTYVPYFWDLVLGGDGGWDDQDNSVVEITKEDIQKFPALRGHQKITLREDSQGFVWAVLD
jgi:hypothetical protein